MVVLFLAQNMEITKFFFIKTALLKNIIILSFVKLVHKSFVSWNKKSSLEYTFKKTYSSQAVKDASSSGRLNTHISSIEIFS